MVLSRDLGLILEPILEENGRQTDRVLAIRATDKETRVRMEFQSENKAEVHCLLILRTKTNQGLRVSSKSGDAYLYSIP
jgi:hypothetical protein